MADLAKLISSKIHKAQDADNKSYKLNKAFPIILKHIYEACGYTPDNLVFVGSSRDGFKVCKKGDVGDIDVMNENNIAQKGIEEKNFDYNEMFPCHCKISVGGELIKRDKVASSELGFGMWELIERTHAYAGAAGGLLGHSFDNWHEKLGEFSIFFYLMQRMFKEIGKQTTSGIGASARELHSVSSNYFRASGFHAVDMDTKIKTWKKEYCKEAYLIYGYGRISKLLRLIYFDTDPEESIPKFMSDVFVEDPVTPSFQTILSAREVTSTLPKSSVDWVASFRVSGWPRPALQWINRTRNWPSDEITSIIATEGFNVVGKPSPKSETEDTDYYLSFARAEFKLCHALSEDKKLCYLAFKILIKFGVEDDNIRSYYLKTVFLWMCERADPADWDNSKLLTNLHNLVHFLIEAYRSHNLQHYFVPEMNLLARSSDEICEDIVVKLSKIIRRVPDCFHGLFERNGDLIIYDPIV